MAVRTSRLDQMEEYIRKHDFVPLDDLCVAFQRSKITIRRDLSMLEEKGVIEKVYGGARPRHRDIGRPVASFTERNICLTDQKQYIGKLAAQHVNDGDTLYIDSGTTTLTTLPYLAERSVTILSNNLYVIMECMNYPQINVISFGGRLNVKTASLTVDDPAELSRFNITKAFMGTTGISLRSGVTDTFVGESTLKSTITKNSRTRYLLADHTKFELVAVSTYARLSDFDFLVTDLAPSQEYLQYCKEHQLTCCY